MSVAYADLPVVVRPLNRDSATETNFVRETALKVRWPRRDGIGWPEWEEMHAPLVDRAMAGQALIADVGGVALGFAIVRPDGALFCLYVKRGFRGEGIGAELLRSVARPLRAVMPTPCWRRWAEKTGLKWEYAR